MVPAFDGYRAAAILAIVVFHTLQNAQIFWGPSGNVVEQLLWASDPGETCLDALFIVSGFVMFLPVASRSGHFGSVRAFAVRRAARLVPAYWLVLVLILLLIAVIPDVADIPFPGVGEILLTFTTLEVPAEFFRFEYYLGFHADRAIWTLSLDVTFYILLVLFATRYFRRPFWGLAISAVIAVVWRVLFNHFGAIASHLDMHPSLATLTDLGLTAEIQFPYWAYSFGVGMTAAWIYVWVNRQPRPERFTRLAPWVQLGSLVAIGILIVCVAAIEPEVIRRSPIITLIYTSSLGCFMLATAMAAYRFQAVFSNRPARWLGDISYGVYLIHLVIITYLVHLFAMPTGTAWAALVWCGIVVPTSIVWGYGSARFLERPVRLRAQKYARRFSAASISP